MVSLEAFSELLEALYSAPLQPEKWQHFLTLVSKHTGSRSGFFISADSRSGLAILAEGGKHQDSELVSSYNQKYAQSDPFRPAVIRYARTKNPVGVLTEEELLPDNGLLRTEMYRELLSQANLRHAAIITLALSVRRLDVISLWRTPEEGPIDADSRRLLDLLVPHIQTALEVRRVFGVMQQRLASAEAMANASSTATFVMTKRGLVRHSNAAAESLIRSGDGLTLVHNHLTARDGKANAALAKLFQDVAAPSFSLSESHPSRFLMLERASGKRPLQLVATPLPETHRKHAGGELLLLVTDPEKPSSFPDDVLHALFDLTPAETEVANGLLMGYSLQEIASLRRVSTGTVRQQVKSMLSKTGTSRQSDMIRLFMTLPQLPLQTQDR